MRSRDVAAAGAAPLGALLAKELRDLAAGRAFWVLLLLLAPLVGYGSEQAMLLYAEASRAAAQTPELARGLSPFDGFLVPTFGALYLATTFLFPFVAIRTIGAEKQDGAHKLMRQLPYAVPTIMAAKIAVLGLAWLAMAAICVSAVVIWMLQGGHVSALESANIILGHALYAVIAAGIGLLAAAITESVATAAILTLAATMGFWVLDFAASGDGGLLKWLSALSITQVLRTFEHGIFSLAAVSATTAVALGLIALACVWWPGGRPLRTTIGSSALVLLATIATVFSATRVSYYADATEDRRNSFSAPVQAALRRIDRPLTVTVELRAEDPRYIDFSKDVLGKLARAVPGISVIQSAGGRTAISAPSDDSYGLITIDCGGLKGQTRSTNAIEILPIVFGLCAVLPPSAETSDEASGHPFIADPALLRIWFYGALPLVILFTWLAATRTKRAGARLLLASTKTGDLR